MKNNLIFLLIIFGLLTGSCKKFLDEKPDAKLDVPTTLSDFQALLDYYPTINNGDPSAGEISGDNYYLLDKDYLALSQDNYRNMYLWQKDNLFALNTNDWTLTYRPVFTANTILEGLKTLPLTPNNRADYNNVKGEALYIRGKAFLKAAGLWTAAYDAGTASTQLGIPLRLSSNFNTQSVRGNLQETYDQIIADLVASAALLPGRPLSALRPSKPAAFALLARTYLYTGNYAKAALYADSSLQLYNTLIDYNTLDSTLAYPIPKFNAEVIHESLIGAVGPINNTKAKVDTMLYNSYSPNDLRKSIFFRAGANGTHAFKGSYEGNITLFGGVATDEVLLIRAESNARLGNINSAMSDLNTLLTNRFKTGTFTRLSATSSAAALSIILTERRKELLMRGIRWDDLKRLNKQGANITLTRIIQGSTYTLLPNDLRYALPIPDDIIQLTGMPQNPR